MEKPFRAKGFTFASHYKNTYFYLSINQKTK